MTEPSIKTERLLLRRWRDDDLPEMTAMNQDPIVMATIGPPMSQADSQAMIDRAETSWRERGYGQFAVELADSHEFIGFIGLAQCRFESHFTPAIEIGWRLKRQYWNLGYATEGALAVLDWAFNSLGLEEVVSFTSHGNIRSRRVMEKLGMVHDAADNFDHPNVALDSPLRPHVLYRKQKSK